MIACRCATSVALSKLDANCCDRDGNSFIPRRSLDKLGMTRYGRRERSGVRERRIVRIRGGVQGVFFRETVRRIAARHGVHGFVRNVGYDVVEIDVEGEVGELARFIDDVLAHPPSAARVEYVESVTRSPTGTQGFSVAPSRDGED